MRGGWDSTYIIAAAVCAKLGGHCDCAAEEEEGIEDVKREGNRGAGHDAREGARYEEDEG